MDQFTPTPTVRSSYLQNRLDDKRAESRNSTYFTPDQRPGTSIRRGRDDSIFDEHGFDTSPRKISLSQSHTPNTPLSQANGTSRRVTSGTGSAVRTMGAREMDEYVNKLSKQNFDLKMELYHRRQKTEDLERRLAGYDDLESSYNESLQLNEELVAELEKRDTALDEAVVMITQLEAQLQQYEFKYESNKDGSNWSNHNHLVPHVSVVSTQDNDAWQHDTSSPPVPPHVDSLHVPSFIRTGAPATNTLRSMYMDGNHQIRQIPSYASLVSNADEMNQTPPEPSGSPVLSDLSDTDLKSIYGSPMKQHAPVHHDPPETTYRDYDDEPDSPPRHPVSDSRDVYVSLPERARHLQLSNKSINAARNSGFGSIGSMLRPLGPASVSSSTRNTDIMRHKDSKGTPPISDNPIFGRNVYPPTPDTMLTRPSNESDSSSLNNRRRKINNFQNSLDYDDMFPTMSSRQDRLSNDSSSLVDQASMLPKEFDAYDDNSERKSRRRSIYTPVERVENWGQAYRDERRDASPVAISTMGQPKIESTRGYQSTARQHIPYRRNSIESFSSQLDQRTGPSLDMRRQLTRSISTIMSPDLPPDLPTFSEAHPGVLPMRHKRSSSDAAATFQRGNLNKQTDARKRDSMVSKADSAPVVETSNVVVSPAKQSQANTLRDRFLNLTRSSPIANGKVSDTPSRNGTMSGRRSQSSRRRGSRSESMTRRIFNKHGTSDEELGGNSLRAAAVAAAPFLSFDLHKNTSPASKSSTQQQAIVSQQEDSVEKKQARWQYV